MASSGQPHRLLPVLLTLHDGEHSFGMSLAQKSPVLGPTYTVVSSVFANSPADRAGVRKGYVVRFVNDKSVGGLTVAQVANYFRNVGQTKVTLEIVEQPQSVASRGETGSEIKQLVKTPNVVPSGRAIAAPGSALAAPSVAPPKQLVPGPRAKPAAKTVALQPHSGSASTSGLHVQSARSANVTALKRSSVDKSLSSRRRANAVRPDKAEAKATTFPIDIDVTSECKSSEQSYLCKTMLQSRDSASVASKGVASAAVVQALQPIALPTLADSSRGIEAEPSLIIATHVPLEASLVCKASPLVAAKQSSTLPVLLPAQPKSPAVTRSLEKATIQTRELSSPSVNSASHTTGATTGAQVASGSTVDSTALAVASASPTLVLKPLDPLKSEDLTSPVPRSKPETVSVKKSSISPVFIAPMPPAPSTALYPVSNSDTSSVVRAAPAAAQSYNPSKSSKKRKRRKNFGQGSRTENNSQCLVERDVMVNSDVAHKLNACLSDSDGDSSLSTNESRKGRRCDRPRQSLTIDRLIGLGFTREDAEASVKEFGDDPDACMVWIISKIEERQFYEDLNRASIQSEQSKRDEEKRVETLKRKTLGCTTTFIADFPTSFMICSESSASNLKRFLQSTVNEVHGGTYIRDLLHKLLTLEGKSIRWYKEAVRSYMFELANRLDTELISHDVMACCVQSDTNSLDRSCAFVRKVEDEVKALTKALFEMPTNQGGVPPIFLECDETTKFDLEDDGFEVLDPNEIL